MLLVKPDKVKIIGVPIDLGADRRGVDMGPSAIRYAGLQSKLINMGIEVFDWGNVNVPVPESRQVVDERKKYLPEILETSEQVASIVTTSIESGFFPLVIGGDHSLSIGTIAGASRAFNNNIGLIWFDTHADYNTPDTTKSGNIHGMPLAISLGHGPEELVNCAGAAPKLKQENTVLIGLRDLDESERQALKKSKINLYTMKEIDKLGMKQVVKEAISAASSGTDGVHVSFDLDVMDPAAAPGVGTPSKGGISYREAHLALELIAEAGVMTSMDVAEVNPIIDKHNITAELAAELILSALGKTIL